MERKLRVVGYVRINKGDNSNSSKALAEEMRDYIISKDEWDCADVLVDAGTGIRLENRFAFQRILEMAINGEIDVVVARTLDRICSDSAELSAICKQLYKAKVRLFFVDDGNYFPEIGGEQMEEVASYIARMEHKHNEKQRQYEKVLDDTCENAKDLWQYLYYHCNHTSSESIYSDDEKIIELKVGRKKAALALTSETWNAIVNAMQAISTELS